LSPWPTLVGLLALAPVRAARGDGAGARAVLAEARAILEAFPDAGVFPELLECQERKLRARKPREGQLDGQLTERELGVLRLLDSEFTSRQMAESLYVAPSTVRTQIKSLYRKLGVSSRGAAVAEAHARGLVEPSPRVNPLGEMRWWVMTDRPAVNYARRPEGYEERR
jgi:LuxR family transcriptional regulator, maltose regulon positive regulatory protein